MYAVRIVSLDKILCCTNNNNYYYYQCYYYYKTSRVSSTITSQGTNTSKKDKTSTVSSTTVSQGTNTNKKDKTSTVSSTIVSQGTNTYKENKRERAKKRTDGQSCEYIFLVRFRLGINGQVYVLHIPTYLDSCIYTIHYTQFTISILSLETRV